MLSLHGKHGVVISRMPVMQNGLGGLGDAANLLI